MPEETDPLITGLRKWASTHDAHVRAAVELLIWHGYWLRRPDFTEACVRYGPQCRILGWDQGRLFLASNPIASTSQLVILDLALALGEDRYRFRIMGGQHQQAIVDAVSRAVGIEPGRAVPVLNGLQHLSIADARHTVQRLDDPGGEPPSRHALETGVRNLLEIIEHLTGASHV